MGNHPGKEKGRKRMAFAAMSNLMKLTKPQLIELRDRCVELSRSNEDDEDKGTAATKTMISRRALLAAAKTVGIAEDPDLEVLDKLFTMFDREGTERVDPLVFLASASPLASLRGVDAKLRFAFEVFDHRGTGRISKGDMASVLGGINAIASYFGDSVLAAHQVDAIVEDTFKATKTSESEKDIAFTESFDALETHPLVVEFATGAGKARYGVGN